MIRALVATVLLVLFASPCFAGIAGLVQQKAHDLAESGFDPITGAYTATTTKTECLFLLGSDISCEPTNGCVVAQTNGTNLDYDSANFAADADDEGTLLFKAPVNLAGTTAEVRFIWAANSAACDGSATADVCWTIDGEGIPDDEAIKTRGLGATLASVTDNCGGSNGDLMISSSVTYTHAVQADEFGVVVIRRDVDGGACAGATDDDFTGTAHLLGVELCFEADNVFNGE